MSRLSKTNFKTAKDNTYSDGLPAGSTTRQNHRDVHENVADSVLFLDDYENIDTRFFDQDDFVYNNGNFTAPNWVEGYGFSGSTSANSTYGIDTTENAIGVADMITGTNSSGYAGIGKGFGTSVNNLVFGTHELTLGLRVAPQNLSDGTDTYSLYFGFGDNQGAGDQGNGAYFRYTHSVNSGKYQAVTASASSRTASDTGIAATTTYKVFSIVVNQAASSIGFYIDGALVATNTLNIPSSSTKLGVFLKIDKSAGTTSRRLSIDWYSLLKTRTSAR